MTTKEEKIAIVNEQIESAKKSAELARKINNKRSLNLANKMIKKAEEDLARLNVD